MTTRLIRFETRADPETGMGHLVRCCSLAVAMDRLERCRFHFPEDLVEIARRIMMSAGSIEGTVLAASHDQVYDLLIVDDPSASRPTALPERYAVTVGLTDEPSTNQLYDLQICPNVLLGESGSRPGSVYGGRELIILHPSYDDQEQRPPGDQVERVLVCFGGSDPANLTQRFVALSNHLRPEASFRLVLGPRYQHSEEIRTVTERCKHIEVIQDLPTLAEEMADCDLVLISGGTLLYEACVMGRPAIVVSQNGLQADESAVFERLGGAVNLGRHDRVSDEQIVSQFRLLSSDASRRHDLSARAKELIPKGGAERAAQLIFERLDQMRRRKI